MSNPFWFNIIHQWKEMGKGQIGVTFPFLVGAVSHTYGKQPTFELVEDVFRKIINEPISSHYCEVRWCGNIDDPVASIRKSDGIDKISIDAQFEGTNSNEVSLAFTTDLMGMFGLDCSTRDECLEKLTKRTAEKVQMAKFSKNKGVFTPFTDEDFEFINHIGDISSDTYRPSSIAT